jgi:serine/threonine-protein kinase
MSSPRFDAVAALFDAACAQPADLRDAFVEGAAADAQVRAQVRRMLASEAAADRLDGALDGALRAIVAPLPARIGAYALLRELGSGGMGTVFLAERCIGEARQRVALKLIRGFPTREARQRLERERALLASLDHPNIARLVDGGESDDGQPYLVMDYIDGERLLDACERRSMSVDARLALFERLCHAVQHAHQRLIVHRDVKPSNVLLRADGDPVLLDFGIGKLLDGGDTAATQAFTPAYAAPEQRRGEPATTASDVYGLGTVLYELAGGRMTDPGRVPAALRGDLARIVHTAMHEHPARRYPTAEALAADVARFRRGLPIAAAPDRFAYRARKYVARHPWGTAAAVVALLVAAGFAWRLAIERDRALRQAERAEATRDLLLAVFDAAAPERTAGNAFSARDLVEFGRRRYADLVPDRADLRLPLATTLARVYLSLGDPRGALALLEPVRALAAGEDRDAVLQRAQVEELLGRGYREVDRVADSAAAHAAALSLRERYASDEPQLFARSLHHVGQAALESGRAAEAEPLLVRALALRAQANPIDPLALAETRRVLALAHLDLGDVARAREEAAAVEAGLDASLPPNHPGRIDALATHATILVRQGRFDEARERLERALAVARASVGERSTITAELENRLADSLLGLGHFREALVHNEAAWRIQREVRADDPVAGAIAQADLGVAYATIGDYARAQALLGDAVAALAVARPADDPERLRARSNLARALSLAGRHADALAILEDVLERTRRTRGEHSERHAFELLRSSSALLRAGRLDEAQARIAQAEPLCRALLPADHPWRGDVSSQRGRIALERGDAALAEREFAAALAMLAPQAGLAYDMRIVAAVGHVEALVRLGRTDQARAEAGAIRADVERELLPGAVERQRLDAATSLLARQRPAPARRAGGAVG